jgi:ribokinase
VVVLTVGGAGCWYTERAGPLYASGPLYHLDAVNEGPLVDTTGCGDVFHGTYAAALARGESVARAVAIANASAGLKTTCPGGRAGIPSLARVEQVLARTAPAQTRA